MTSELGLPLSGTSQPSPLRSSRRPCTVTLIRSGTGDPGPDTVPWIWTPSGPPSSSARAGFIPLPAVRPAATVPAAPAFSMSLRLMFDILTLLSGPVEPGGDSEARYDARDSSESGFPFQHDLPEHESRDTKDHGRSRPTSLHD